MDGDWQWGSSQGPPFWQYHWPASQLSQSASQFSRSVPQPAHEVYGRDQFPPPAIHESFHALRSRTDQAPTSSLSSVQQVQHHDDDGLDDFDRQLLSMSELPAAHPQSARRLTLPLAEPSMRPAFQQPFQPMFQPVDHSHGYAASMFALDHQGQQPGPGYSLPPQLPYHPEPRTGTTTTTMREPVHRQGELQQRLQQGTPPLHSASYAYPQVEKPATPPVARRSSDVELLSPSQGVSLRKQSRSYNPSQREALSMSSQQHSPANTSSELILAPPIVNGIQLLSPRQVLPDNLLFQSIFPYSVFNAVQSKCFESVYASSDNLVVSAPTGSGKTAIFELAICKIVAERGPDNIKIVYQAPTKALCGERAREWQKKFSSLKLQCAELTGDTSPAEMRRVGSASIIVTTPEKWDSITRKWHDHQKLLQLVALFLIDEVHILKDIRGATLEAVVSRMKSIGTDVRFVALSATIPNSEDIATWLGKNVKNQHLPARRETFGDEFRPVKLVRHVFGFDKRMNDHSFDRFLDSKLPPLLSKYTEGKPILIFCFTRKSCENTAAKLAEWWTSQPEDAKSWHKPPNPIRVLGRELQELVKTGVAFHHAGLAPDDRQAVERAFLQGGLSVICCTSTLAVGVNLPCHTVVLKGTATYQNDAIHELSDLEALQMLGRAGRPQFDDSANALILTSSDQKERYDRMASGTEVLESTLHLNLIEHLNSEIGLRTITDMQSAKKWLAGTFLSVRMRKNPSHYRLAEGTSTAKDTDSMLEEICERDIRLLQEYEIITKDRVFKQTAYGGSMSRYMVEFNTMKLLLEFPRALNMEQLLSALAKANEFREFKFKPADGQIFRDVNKSPFILYPINENVTKTWHKVSLVVQLHLGGADYPDSSESQKQRHQLRAEKKGIFERLQRLVRCVAECKGHECDSVSTNTALELARSLAAGAWEGRPSELLQIPAIGPVNMRKLVSQGVKAVKDLVHKNHGELEHCMSRKPPFGNTMSNHLKQFPLLDFTLALPSREYTSISDEAISVPVVATLRYLNETGLPNWHNKVPSVTFVAETTTGLLVYFWKGRLDKIPTGTGLELRFSAEIKAPDERIVCHFSCEEIVGTVVSKSLEHSIPVSSFRQLKQRSQQLDTAQAMSGPPETKAGKAVAKDVSLPHSTDTSLLQEMLDDADAVEAAAALLAHDDKLQASKDASRKTDSQKSAETNYSDGDFPMIEDILQAVSPPSPFSLQPAQSQTPGTYRSSAEPASEGDIAEKDPVRLPNGKWQCNHACTGGALTKAGKRCTHRCCLEGLDKPRKIKPKAAESKKRKAEGPSEPGENKAAASTTSAGPSNISAKPAKKQRLGKQPESTQDAANTPWKPMFHPPSDGETTAARCGDFKYEPIDLSNLDDDYGDLPDLAGLASYKTKHKAHGADVFGADNTPASSMASSLMDDYMPSAPPATTTDYGDLDDDFDDDFDFEMPSAAEQGFLAQDSSSPATRRTAATDGAFRSGAQDAMLFTGIARPASPGNGTKSELALASLSPESYKEALEEAARLCDIDSQMSFFQHNMDTPPPDDFDLFNEGLTSFTDTTTPADDDPVLASPGAAALGGALEDTATAVPSPDAAAAKQVKQDEEPAWVQDFDQEFIDSFRGYVNFI